MMNASKPAQVAPLTFSIREQVVAAKPYPEDEEQHPRELSIYYVVAEAADGSRLQHEFGFSSDNREFPVRSAELLLERVQAAHANNVPLDLASWSAIQPCYGSEAYTAQYARWEARNDLADGSYDPGSRREAELRAAA